MSKRRNDIENQIEDVVEAEKPMSSSNSVQNTPPNHGWPSFDSFWNSTVKNGTPLLKESFKSHLRAMGWLEDPSKWIKGAIHFGITIEKKK